jgi:hypothetical protein
MDSTGWIDSRVYPGLYGRTVLYRRTAGFTPPLMETGVRSVAVDKHTSKQAFQNKRTLSKKNFHFKLGLEFVDIKSRS